MAAGYPSAYGTYVPSFDATGNLITNFSRSPKEFALNEYVTLLPVKEMTGHYLVLNPENAARIRSADLKHWVWPDGARLPFDEAGWNVQKFEFKPYICERYAYNASLGYLAVKQAAWDITKANSEMLAQQAMTGRTVKTLAVATAVGNYPTGHTGTATALGGGFWSAGTLSARYIQKALQAAAQQIQ